MVPGVLAGFSDRTPYPSGKRSDGGAVGKVCRVFECWSLERFHFEGLGLRFCFSFQTPMKPPEVHSELTSDGNDGLLALRPGSSGSFCQDGEPVLHRVISGLKTHHAPCQLNQNSPQSAISMFCDRTWHAFGPRAILARTEACVTGDLASVLEALPIADLTANDYAAQGAHARGQRGRSCLLQLDIFNLAAAGAAVTL